MKKEYRTQQAITTSIDLNQSYEGETIEKKIRRITQNKEPISDGAPLIYTERKDGVQPQYDIRTDRFAIAIEAMDKVTATHRGRRDQRLKMGEEAKQNMEKEAKTEKKKDGGAEPQQTT
jgi:hypothetical protein